MKRICSFPNADSTQKATCLDNLTTPSDPKIGQDEMIMKAAKGEYGPSRNDSETQR